MLNVQLVTVLEHPGVGEPDRLPGPRAGGRRASKVYPLRHVRTSALWTNAPDYGKGCVGGHRL